nr:MAG TPA: hypothetical protein [Bacteriophage sp.]
MVAVDSNEEIGEKKRTLGVRADNRIVSDKAGITE